MKIPKELITKTILLDVVMGAYPVDIDEQVRILRSVADDIKRTEKHLANDKTRE